MFITLYRSDEYSEREKTTMNHREDDEQPNEDDPKTTEKEFLIKSLREKLNSLNTILTNMGINK